MLNHLPAFENHLKILYGLSPITVSVYSSKIREFYLWLRREGKTTDPKNIIHKDVEAYLEHLFYKGNKNITRTTKLVALAKFFRYLIYEKTNEKDPTKDIPRPRIVRKLMLTFTKDEVYRFFKQCDNKKEKGMRDICILIFAVFCGLRMSEIINLNIDSIIDDGKDIDIFVRGKKGYERQVYLWKSPGAFFRQYLLMRLNHGAKSSEPFLISYGRKKTSRRLTTPAIDTLIKKLAKRAGIRRPEIHAHMFRATHANDLQHIKGYTLPAIQERLGWKDLSTAGRYLVRRERVHKIYDSLHAYWREFAYLYIERKEDKDNEPGGTIAEVGQ